MSLPRTRLATPGEKKEKMRIRGEKVRKAGEQSPAEREREKNTFPSQL